MARTADNSVSKTPERKPTSPSRLNFYSIDEVEAFVAALGRLEQCDGHCRSCRNPCSAQAGVLEAEKNDRSLTIVG